MDLSWNKESLLPMPSMPGYKAMHSPETNLQPLLCPLEANQGGGPWCGIGALKWQLWCNRVTKSDNLNELKTLKIHPFPHKNFDFKKKQLIFQPDEGDDF